MKRSQMVDILCQYIGNVDKVNIILKIIEENGMLPPRTDYYIKNQPDGFIQLWEEVADYHKWEPENEEK